MTLDDTAGDSPSRIKDLLIEAVELSPEERDALMARLSADDPDMHRQLQDLLAAWEHATGVLREPTRAAFVPRSGPGSVSTPVEREGDQIGRYTLGPQIGEGGFGVVHRAFQDRPVRRAIALKVLKPGMDSKAVLSRFDAERQALARLTHPSIARIFDAGTTPSGRPYFAMELVDGEPIGSYCDRRRLSILERMRLFMRVCAAVQHAHQKGIIHRDLKPSNVLVTEADGEPEVKVIDFGIAKAIDEPLTDMSMITAAHQIIGTPRYMSPEQASLDLGAVDTRSDVYSLGVLLYEMLCGSTPLTSDEASRIGIHGLARRLTDGAFARPSVRVREAAPADATAIASARDSEPERLVRTLAGDPDWIAMRAIEAEPDRRYVSAFALLRDIERYLSDEPTEARAPTGLYLVRKFVQRHRAPVAASLAVLVALVGGLAAALWGLRQAEIERDFAQQSLVEANAVVDFLNRVFSSIDPTEHGFDVKVADVLADASGELAGNPELSEAVRGRLYHIFGDAWWQLGNFRQAENHFRNSIRIRKAIFGEYDTSTLMVQINLGMLLHEQGRAIEAIELVEPAVAGLERTLGDHDVITVGALGNYALLLNQAGRYNEAIVIERRVVKLRESIHGPDHPRTIGAMHNYANTLADTGRSDEAETMYLEALARGERALGEDAPETVLARSSLANFYHASGRNEEAKPVFEKVIEQRREIYGEAHPQTLLAMYNYGANAQQMEDYPRAMECMLKILDAVPEHLPPSHEVATQTYLNIITIHGIIGWETAPPGLKTRLENLIGQASEMRLAPSLLNNMAYALMGIPPQEEGRLRTAERLARDAVHTAEELEDPFLYGYLDTRAQILTLLGRFDEAVETADAALALVPTGRPDHREAVEATRQAAVDARTQANQHAAASPGTDLEPPSSAPSSSSTNEGTGALQGSGSETGQMPVP